MKLFHSMTVAVSVLLLSQASGVAATEGKGSKDKAAKPYPLAKCLISDEKLGDHGKPYAFVHEGQEVKLCCKACLKDFKKDPAKHLKKMEAEAKKGNK